MIDRRKFVRLPVRPRCWCEGGNITIYAHMSNIAEGGAFVTTHAPFDKQDKVRLRFNGEDGREIDLFARVGWRTDKMLDSSSNTTLGMGLCFEELAEPALSALRGWLHELRDGVLERSP